MDHSTNPPRRVLVLDADFPACLTIIRSLTVKNILCDIASSADAPISGFSRYANNNYHYPDPLNALDSFIDFIVALLETNQYDLIIPITERTLIPLARSAKLSPWRKQLAIADNAGMDQVLDKSQTIALAMQCKIPVPYSYKISALAELQGLATRLDYPAVIKPTNSIPDSNQRQQLSVGYAYDANELTEAAQEILKLCPVLIQQYVPGQGTGIELLANQGDIVYAFQHQRLHELPLTGGGSSYRKSSAINPALLAASRQLISALNWHGVAMVEFKFDPESGNYWLMEINGRFWGSLPLAYAAGADFPAMLVELLLDEKLPSSQTFRENIYCRNLSRDIYWTEQVLRRNEDSRLVKYPKTGQLIVDWLFMLHPSRHYFDVQCWHDPVPGAVDLYRTLIQYWRRVSELLVLKHLAFWHRSKWMQIKLRKQLRNAKSILFVCYGNINRSILAQAFAEQYYADSAVHFNSAGFHPHPGRPADISMQRIAAENELDLTNCSSKTLEYAMLEHADIIFVMERLQYIRMTQEHPRFANKTFLLGSLTSNNSIDIADPYNQAIGIYKNCFQTVCSAVRNLKLL